MGVLLLALPEEVQPHIVYGYIDAIGTYSLAIDEHSTNEDGVGALDGGQQQERNDVC